MYLSYPLVFWPFFMLHSLLSLGRGFRVLSCRYRCGLSASLAGPRLVSAGCPYNAAGFNLICAEIDPIPAGGQPQRSHPIRVPGDCITSRIRRCHVPNKYILITHTVRLLAENQEKENLK